MERPRNNDGHRATGFNLHLGSDNPRRALLDVGADNRKVTHCLASLNRRARGFFSTDPIFARAIVDELAECYRGVIKNTKNLKLRTSIERLANYLLRVRK